MTAPTGSFESGLAQGRLRFYPRELLLVNKYLRKLSLEAPTKAAICVFLCLATVIATLLSTTIYANSPAMDEAGSSSREQLLGRVNSLVSQPRTLLFPATSNSSGAKSLGAITTTEMSELLGLETVEVLDLEFQRLKTFEGVSLRKLLEYIEIDVGEQLVFVATDGYEISFDSSLLRERDLRGLVAFRDLEAPENLNWELFQHGRELVNFDPFYLVWAIEEDDLTDPDTERLYSLPWPYQLNEIRIVSADQYAAAAPTADMGDRASSGFNLYVKHCIKCHQVKGLGGQLGPAIDREHSWASLIEADVLKEIVWRVSDFISETKMPDYREILSEQDVADLVIYMQSIQP